MEELTKTTEEVVVTTESEVTEEETGIGAGTVLTGVCALTGALAIAYGAYKGVKWAAGKVKTAIGKKKADNDDIIDEFDDDFNEEGSYEEPK